MIAQTKKGAAVNVRAQTSQLVVNVAVQSGEPQHAVYSRIYARLHSLYGVDVYAYPRGKNESLLSVAERYDLIDKVYTIAYAEHLYSQQFEE